MKRRAAKVERKAEINGQRKDIESANKDNAIESFGSEEKKTVPRVEAKAVFPELVEIVLDPKKRTRYLVKRGGKLRISDQFKSDDDIIYVPPKRLLIKPLSATNVVYRCCLHDRTLFEDILEYLKRFSYLEEDEFLLLGLFTFLTYIQDHPQIFHLPIIAFIGPPARGKTRLGKALISISYRGHHLTSVTAPNVFRLSDYYASSIFFDVTDIEMLLRSGLRDIMLARYEKGGEVSRVTNMDRGPFNEIQIFKVFGPTIIASNQTIDPILESRCFEFNMRNKPGAYDFSDLIVAEELRERLTGWRSKHMDSPLPRISGVNGIHGRLWDISKPLLQICAMVCPQYETVVQGSIKKLSIQKQQAKLYSDEGQILLIIDDYFTENPSEKYAPTDSILAKVNEDRAQADKYGSRDFGRKIKAIGISTDRATGRSRIKKDQELKTLFDSYGIGKNSENSGNSESEDKLIKIS